MKLFPAMLFSIMLLLPLPGIAEDEYWGNIQHGSSYQTNGFTFYRDGTSAQEIGNFKFYSDGKTETTIGNYTFRSDGKSSIKIRDFTYRSDGNSGVDIGNFHFYDGKSIMKMDGYRWADR